MLKARVATGATYTLVLVLTVELALWESFLVAARPFGIALPVSAVLAVVGNVVLGRAGARVLQRPLGAVIPGVLWLAIVLRLGTGQPGGDRIVPGTFRGLAFLLAGTIAGAAVIGTTGSRGTGSATPEGPERR